MKATFTYNEIDKSMRIEFNDIPKDYRGVYKPDEYQNFLREIIHKAHMLINDSDCYTK